MPAFSKTVTHSFVDFDSMISSSMRYNSIWCSTRFGLAVKRSSLHHSGRPTALAKLLNNESLPAAITNSPSDAA